MKPFLRAILLLVFIVSAAVTAYNTQNNAPIAPIAALQQLTSPGGLSTQHSHLSNDCDACHTAVKGPSPAKCMACHITAERLSVWPELQFHFAVPNCRGCHQEHQGTGSIATKMDHNLIAEMSFKELLKHDSEMAQALTQPPAAQDTEAAIHLKNSLSAHSTAGEQQLRCATCHLERDPHKRMFGLQCGSCHNTEVWMIPAFRHPPNTSTVCSECHRAPPCHFTAHFKQVCAPAAGRPNTKVSDCHSCHKAPSWNLIEGAGWFKTH